MASSTPTCPSRAAARWPRNLIGNHIDSTVNNPSEQLGFYEAGKSRPLAAFLPERLAVFSDVPTFKELGHDLVYYMQRSVVGPPEMPADAQAFYEGVFQKVHESAEWKEYTSKKALFRSWLTGDDLMSYFSVERDKHAELLKAMGEIN